MGCKNGKPVLRPEDKEALAKTSGLSEDEVESKFEAFLKDHPDGKLRKKDFREMMSQVGNIFDNQLQSNSCIVRLFQRKTLQSWRSMYSAFMTPMAMGILTLLSSWWFSTSFLMEVLRMSSKSFSGCLM